MSPGNRFAQPLSPQSTAAAFSSLNTLQILGVSREATDPEINRAYRKLARVYHPDMPTGE